MGQYSRVKKSTVMGQYDTVKQSAVMGQYSRVKQSTVTGQYSRVKQSTVMGQYNTVKQSAVMGQYSRVKQSTVMGLLSRHSPLHDSITPDGDPLLCTVLLYFKTVCVLGVVGVLLLYYHFIIISWFMISFVEYFFQ